MPRGGCQAWAVRPETPASCERAGLEGTSMSCSISLTMPRRPNRLHSISCHDIIVSRGRCAYRAWSGGGVDGHAVLSGCWAWWARHPPCPMWPLGRGGQPTRRCRYVRVAATNGRYILCITVQTPLSRGLHNPVWLTASAWFRAKARKVPWMTPPAMGIGMAQPFGLEGLEDVAGGRNAALLETSLGRGCSTAWPRAPAVCAERRDWSP